VIQVQTASKPHAPCKDLCAYPLTGATSRPQLLCSLTLRAGWPHCGVDEPTICGNALCCRVYHFGIKWLPLDRNAKLCNCSQVCRREKSWVLGSINAADSHATERIPRNQTGQGTLQHSFPLTFQCLCQYDLVCSLLDTRRWHLCDQRVMDNG